MSARSTIMRRLRLMLLRGVGDEVAGEAGRELDRRFQTLDRVVGQYAAALAPPGRVDVPDSMPLARGPQAATLIPYASAIGSSSRSMSRLGRLYGTCRPAKAAQRHTRSVQIGLATPL